NLNAIRNREVQSVESLQPRLPDQGAALFFLARRYAQLGNPQKSLVLLKKCISLDQGFDPDPATVPAFQALSSQTEFRQLLEHVHRRYPPVHQAHVAFTVHENDLFPEGLAADPERRLFYMGSMHRKKIIQITEDGEVSDFVKPDLYNLTPV